MSQKVGRITLAIALIVMGVILMIDTFQHTQISWYVARLWPVLLILLGLEWVAAARGQGPRVDGGAVALLVVVALVAAGAGASWRSPIGQPPRRNTWTIPAPPSPPPLPAVPRIIFGDVAEEVVQTQDLDAAGVQSLSVNGEGMGDIRVEQGDKFRVELRVTGYGRDRDSARENARMVRLNVQKGPATRIGADRPSGMQKLGLSFVVTVPPDVALNLDAASGSIMVAGRKASVTAQTSSGSVRVEDVAGPADLRSASGSITATGIGGDLTASSSSGRIDATNVKGNLKLSASSGDIAIRDVAGKVSAQTSSGQVKLTTGQVGGEYDLTATSGSIRLEIPAAAGVSVSARTTSGSVTGPAWLTIGEGKGSGTGAQGDGAYKLTLRTSSGSIAIDAR